MCLCTAAPSTCVEVYRCSYLLSMEAYLHTWWSRERSRWFALDGANHIRPGGSPLPWMGQRSGARAESAVVPFPGVGVCLPTAKKQLERPL